MKKKILSLALALALCLGLAVPVLAAEGEYVTVYQLYHTDGTPFLEEPVEDFWYPYDNEGNLVGLIAVKQNGKWGYVDADGATVIPFQYEDAGAFNQGLACVKTGGKYGYIDVTGQMVIQPAYDEAGSFGNNGLAVVAQGEWVEIKWGRSEFSGLYGLIDKTGKVVLPLEYNSVGYSQDNTAYDLIKEVQGEDYVSYFYGRADAAGKVIIPAEYSGIYRLSTGEDGSLLLKIAKGEDYSSRLYGLADETGKVILPVEYSDIDTLSAGEDGSLLLKIAKGEDYSSCLYGLADGTGKVLVEPKYDSISTLTDDVLSASVEDSETGKDQYYLLDHTGKELASLGGDRPTDEGGGVIKAGKTRYDSTGKEIASYPVTTVSGRDASGRYSYGYADKDGNVVIPYTYAEAKDFAYGVAVVQQFSGGWTVIDTQGNEVIPGLGARGDAKYDNDIKIIFNSDLNGPLISVVMRGGGSGEDDRFATYNAKGEKVFDVIADSAWALSRRDDDGPVLIQVNLAYSKKGVVTPDGDLVLPMDEYQDLRCENGMLIVKKGINKYGVYSAQGEEILPCQYYYVTARSDGFIEAQFHSDDALLYGLFDQTGKEILPCEYDSCRVSGNYIIARINGDYEAGEESRLGIFDLTGKAIIPMTECYAAGAGPVLLYTAHTEFRAATAYSSTRTVQVDGKAVDFYAYALKDNDGNETEYFKLRDVAAILNGTDAQFQVGWNGAINITTGAAYTPNGSENIANFSGDQPYTVNVSPVRVDGVETALEAITLTDANGGGYTYFKLQDLGVALGFQVEESAEGGISIKTDKP